jgi:hypothetical protein
LEGSIMDIPLVSSLPLGSVGNAAAVAPAQARVIENAVIVAAPPAALTTVDLSPLGQFLSATSLFQKKLLELQASATTVPEGQAFSDIAAATTTLAVAFNELLTSGINGTDENADPLDQQSLAASFAQQFAAQTAAAGADADTALASLGTIGLVLNPNPALAPGQPLRVDLPLLQVALEVDPATTNALLSRAGNAFAALVDAGVEPAELDADPQPAATPQGPVEAARENVFRQGLPIENPAPSASPTATVVPAPATSQAVPAASLLVEAQSPALAPANPAPARASVAESNGELAAAAAQVRPSAQEESAVVSAQTPPANTAATPVTPESNAQASNQTAAAAVTRATAERDLAERALELAENKRTQSDSEEERAALFDAIEEQDRLNADEFNVLNKTEEQQRLQRANDARNLNGEPAPARVPATDIVNAVPRNVPPEEDSAAVQAQPPVPLHNNVQQAARDPAIAAAIAAYHLNTGPFAALNARQESAAPKIKTVPPVSTVAKVAPTDLV